MSSECRARTILGMTILSAAVVFSAGCAKPTVEVVNVPAAAADYEAARVPTDSQQAWDMPADELIELTTLGERISLINPDVLANQQTAIDLLTPVLTESNKTILDLDTPRPDDRNDYTDQQLLNDFSLATATASVDSDPETSKKMLSIAMDSNSPEFTPMFQSFDLRPGGNASLAVFRSNDTYRPLLPGMEFMGTTFGANESGRITKSNVIEKDGSIGEEHFRLFKISGDVGNQAITQMAVWFGSDPRVEEAIRNGNFEYQ